MTATVSLKDRAAIETFPGLSVRYLVEHRARSLRHIVRQAPGMVLSAATSLEKAATAAARRLLALLEPVLILTTAVVGAFIIVSLRRH